MHSLLKQNQPVHFPLRTRAHTHSKSIPSPCMWPMHVRHFYPRHMALSAGTTQPILLPEISLLQSWLVENGGYVSPCLAVVDPGNYGCRGVVSVARVGLDVLQSEPLILVPEKLYLTSEYARERLNGFLLANSKPPLSHLEGAEQLAVILALERNKGLKSFWYPYINALPTLPPCGWQMPPQELHRELDKFGAAASTWPEKMAYLRSNIRHRATVVERTYGDLLRISADDFFWAIGQVLSRSFGAAQDLGLAPYIDLLNHKQGAHKPALVDVHGEPYVYVTSSASDEPWELNVGDELCISYVTKTDPLLAFSNFGFVPPELWKLQ